MNSKKIAIAVLALGAWLAWASQASAAPEAPAWRLTLTSQPTNFVPGEANVSSFPQYFIVATNIGAKPTEGPITITDTLPGEISPDGVNTAFALHNNKTPFPCNAAGQVITCTDPEPVNPGENEMMEIPVNVGAFPDPSTVIDQAEISGGNALSVSTETTTTISSALADFNFLSGPNGLSALLTDPDGAPVTLAGAHPYQLTIDLGLTSRRLGVGGVEEVKITGSGGGLRDLESDLPRGLVVNPLATPELCSEAQLESHSCPNSSAVGIVTVLTPGISTPQPNQSPLYNMVPPAGTPAELGFDVAGVGVFAHLKGGVRSDGDYGLFATTNDILSRAPNPALGAQAQLWGDPSDPSHDTVRGACDTGIGPPSCPVAKQSIAFISMPSACADSIGFAARADSWGTPGTFHSASAPATDAAGNPVALTGCEELDFKPAIEARPTTNLIDSPSGLDVDVHLPQKNKLEEGRSSATLKDATLTLPEGMAVNPSQADGLGACTPEQIGFDPATIGQLPIRFSKAPASCPDAAKIGSVSVSTPLLKHPLPGSIYIAKPFANPFGSLLAVYLAVNDPQTGVVAKLAGKVQADPVTGQLTNTFTENPDLPIEDVRVHLFGGPRAALLTPPACATYTTTAELTPWSSPKGLTRTDSFPISAAPAGKPCPASAGAAPNQPGFSAGTLSPQAGAYSPLVLKLSREDGSQRFARVEATLPPGLSAKLAGVAQCSEADIAKAKAREHPNEGALEAAAPSCPAASEVGTVDVGLGAGPTPYYTQGHVYLAGPYKGAPLSLAVIAPAVAGPFDLGAVVVRAALYIDPTTAQGRAVSDPMPTILDGIPLDVRSVVVKMSRPRFTFNPTSCDPLAFSGAATSTLGQIAPLSSRFQAGGCKALPYKPKLHTRLFGPIHRGGHPRLRAVFEAKPGEANTARFVFALPHSEFIDQSHFRTICTRVQFAAAQCPPGAVYGHVKVISPQVDYPLEGPIYLRSSSHQLPDVVAVLKGPPSQPVEVDLDGRVDSLNGGIRTTVETVPDAPVSKAIITLQGGKKGLFQNSTNICKGIHRASLKLNGQNGKTYDSNPVLKADCPKAGKEKGKRDRK